jgi:hypothetical protein
MSRTGSMLVGALAVLLTIAAVDLPPANQVTPSISVAPAPATDIGAVPMEPAGRPMDLTCDCWFPDYWCPDGLTCSAQGLLLSCGVCG